MMRRTYAGSFARIGTIAEKTDEYRDNAEGGAAAFGAVLQPARSSFAGSGRLASRDALF
jgi:hypothetical protein